MLALPLINQLSLSAKWVDIQDFTSCATQETKQVLLIPFSYSYYCSKLLFQTSYFIYYLTRTLESTYFYYSCYLKLHLQHATKVASRSY